MCLTTGEWNFQMMSTFGNMKIKRIFVIKGTSHIFFAAIQPKDIGRPILKGLLK